MNVMLRCGLESPSLDGLLRVSRKRIPNLRVVQELGQGQPGLWPPVLKLGTRKSPQGLFTLIGAALCMQPLPKDLPTRIQCNTHECCESMPSSISPRLAKVAYASLAIVFLFLAVDSIRETLPPSKVVIETGPVGGSYHDNALRYAKKLEAAGFKTEIRANPQSLETIDRIQSGKPHVDIGFTILPLDRSKYTNTVSVGVVELQPLFIFINAEKGRVTHINQLLGKRLVMPPEKSVTAQTSRSTLALYGITPDNTT